MHWGTKGISKGAPNEYCITAILNANIADMATTAAAAGANCSAAPVLADRRLAEG
jgi:hypothetical protein